MNGLGLARIGQPGRGKQWRGKAGLGKARQTPAGAWRGEPSRGAAGRCVAWASTSDLRWGEVWFGLMCPGRVWRGTAWVPTTTSGQARSGAPWLGSAGLGLLRRGMDARTPTGGPSGQLNHKESLR